MKKLMSVILGNKKTVSTGLVLLMALVPALCVAFTAPTAGEFGFTTYDFIMNTMMSGALGIMICAICVGLGIYACVDRQRGGIPVGVGFFILASALANIEPLVESIGFMM